MQNRGGMAPARVRLRQRSDSTLYLGSLEYNFLRSKIDTQRTRRTGETPGKLKGPMDSVLC
jgi:hypothetical protein